MEEITQLIPFKVKCMTISKEEVDETSINRSKPERMIESLQYSCRVKDIVINKIWTVVGIKGHYFLLAREGELTQWYSILLCEVVSI